MSEIPKERRMGKSETAKALEILREAEHLLRILREKSKENNPFQWVGNNQFQYRDNNFIITICLKPSSKIIIEFPY